MDFVVKDTGGDWFFDGEKTYWCLDKDKKPIRKLYKEYLPDPMLLWKRRCDDAGVAMNSDEGKQLKADVRTIKLWEHANAE